MGRLSIIITVIFLSAPLRAANRSCDLDAVHRVLVRPNQTIELTPAERRTIAQIFDEDGQPRAKALAAYKIVVNAMTRGLPAKVAERIAEEARTIYSHDVEAMLIQFRLDTEKLRASVRVPYGARLTVLDFALRVRELSKRRSFVLAGAAVPGTRDWMPRQIPSLVYRQNLTALHNMHQYLVTVPNKERAAVLRNIKVALDGMDPKTRNWVQHVLEAPLDADWVDQASRLIRMSSPLEIHSRQYIHKSVAFSGGVTAIALAIATYCLKQAVADSIVSIPDPLQPICSIFFRSEEPLQPKAERSIGKKK